MGLDDNTKIIKTPDEKKIFYENPVGIGSRYLFLNLSKYNNIIVFMHAQIYVKLKKIDFKNKLYNLLKVKYYHRN